MGRFGCRVWGLGAGEPNYGLFKGSKKEFVEDFIRVLLGQLGLGVGARFPFLCCCSRLFPPLGLGLRLLSFRVHGVWRGWNVAVAEPGGLTAKQIFPRHIIYLQQPQPSFLQAHTFHIRVRNKNLQKMGFGRLT